MAQVIVDFSCQPGRVTKSWETHLKEGLCIRGPLQRLSWPQLKREGLPQLLWMSNSWAETLQAYKEWKGRRTPAACAHYTFHPLTADAISRCSEFLLPWFPQHDTLCSELGVNINPFCLKFLCSEYLPQQQERHQDATGIRTWILISTPIGKLVWKCVSITSALGL